ncbi:hemagglutinin repeat-containing protein [Paraburkholderia nemoris]|uniref:hemagglutinin repeat-containing protein n=1 Tax=Paraburkholderia nemoris TaxID=2793076 RepID=UPI0038B78F62
MNKNIYRVIFNAARGLWTAVQETATGTGKGRSSGATRRTPSMYARVGFVDMLSMRHVAFAALCILGMQPLWADAQVVAAPASGSKPIVGVTANGLPIVQIATPNSAGVSNNPYTQYNVGSQGLILNNSPGNVQTQLGGYVTGNPNLGAGSARVIVNQVVGGNASQLLGYTEVAGQKAEVVIANPAGIYCNGCGFINTSRGVLTTGTPVFGGTGSLDAFHVTGGQIQIGTTGLNGSNVDQVDLIARSVAINGKVWAGQSLNVVAGNNDVRYSDLSAQSLGSDGNSPGVAIDVAQLGGMYAGKIMLVGTEAGVGVNSAGTIASQGGDVQISSQGKITLSGSTSANGNVAISAAGDAANSGSVYATQNTTLNSQGQVTNSSTIAALGNTSVTGASVNSTGSLGAGVDANGNVTGTGNLSVTGSGAVTAAGQQMAGGNLALSGSSLNMAGGQTLTKGNASLTATGAGGDTGNIVHTGASLQTSGILTANAAGTVTNDQGQVSAAQLSVTAGGISNRGGTLSQTGASDTTLAASGAFDNTGGTVTTNAQNTAIRSGSLTNANGTISQAGTGALGVQTGALDNGHGSIGTNGVATIAATSLQNGSGSITSAQALNVASSGNIDNTAGRLEAAGAVNVSGANVQNTAGRIVSGNGDGLTLTASGQITNAAGTTAQGATGGVIGGNGNATINAATLANSGTATAAQNLQVATSGTLDNSGGSMSAAALKANAASLKNANGTISASTMSVTAPQFDNSGGKITANQISVSATNLTNHNGALTQLGSGAMGVNVSGMLDNSGGGLIQTNSTDLTLAPSTLNNNGGTITHAGTGTLTIDSGSGTGSLTNVGGKIVTNGLANLSAGSMDDTGGTISAQTGLNATVAGALNNTNGQLESSGDLSVTSGSAITNANGTISAAGNETVQAASLTNSGSVTAGQNLNTTVTGTLDNSGGTLSAQTVTANAASLKNANGTISADTVSVTAPQLDNSGGKITTNHLALVATNLTNGHGSITQLGAGAMGLGVSGTLDNSNGGVIQTKSTDLTLAPETLNNNGGTITHAGTGTLSIDAANSTGAVTNVGGSIISNGRTALSAGSVDNTGGAIGGHAGLVASVSGALNNTHGQLASNVDLSVSSGGILNNASGVIVATGNNSVQAASLTNSGSITAGQNLDTTVAGTLDNSGGTLSAQTVTASAASFRNTNGVVSGNAVSMSIAQLDNSDGRITTNQLGVTATNLTNEGGSITQLGTGAMGLGVSGTLDNSNGGVIQTKSADLTLAPATLNNNGGTITHAGTGTLSIDAADGTGAVTNVGGSIVSNGQVALNAGSLDDTGGSIGGQSGLSATLAGALNNTRGQLQSNGNLSVTSGAGITNTSGTIAASGNNTVQAASLTNGGSITAGQSLNTTVSGTLDNGNGTLSAQAITANAASFRNANGVVSGNAVTMSIAQLDNSNGRITTNQLGVTATNLTNEGGSITQLGTGAMGLGVSGALDNSNGGVIQTNSTDLTLASASVNNNSGTITHAGTGTLTIKPSNGTGSLTNVGGKIVTNGQASVSVGSLNNTGGKLASQGVMTATVQGTLNNTNGRLSSGTGLTATSGGQLINAGGVIGAGGAATGSTLSLAASLIDNSGGAITNLGNGATTINGGSQIANSNAGNTSGMGSISGNGNVTLNATSISNTQGGQLSGANLQINTGNLDNTGGEIGNVANMTGDVGIATGMLTATSGQINASRNLSVTANTLAGGGTYSAVNDLSLNLQGNFTTSPNYGFSAGHNLSFTLPGTFSNGGALSAVNGLNINAGDIQNSGTLGAGGLLTTHSNTLTNTGTIVGSSVSLNATQSLSNLGTTALIGATDSAGTLELLAPDIENRDDTSATDTQATTAIYGLGKVVLAGGKDGSGNYTNANLIRNQSALIQSGGDMEIDANQVTNTRRVMTTGGFTSSIDPALLQSLGISLSGCDATYLAACGPGNPQVLGSRGDPTLIGGVPTDPPHGGQWNSTYQYTTYTGDAVANTVTSVSPESQIIAGGNLNASSVGTFQNYWSQVAATGNIASPTTLDQNSWQGQSAPQVQVTYSGQYHYDNYDNSEHNWQLPFGNASFVTSNPGGYTQAAPADIRTYALPAYESSFTAGGTLSGTGVTINNTAGNAGVTPLGLLPGQTLSGSGAGSVSGTIGAQGVGAIGAGAVSGTIGTNGVGAIGAGVVSGLISVGSGVHPGAVAIQGGRLLNSGLANFNNPIIAAATAVKVLNNITVPQGGLFHADTAPNAPYLVETNPAFTNQQQWLSSDYYFQQMGMNPAQIQMRLGDGFYEQKLVQDQVLSMTGKSVLTNYANTQDEFKTLMTSGAALAKSLDLAPGTGLSPEQVSQLTSNVVIMQTQIVDGQSVLVPVVYLAQASQENMGNGPVIAATNIDLQNAQTVTNSGTIKAANSFAISGQSIDSSFGTLQSGGQMSLVTTGDVNLTSATLNAGSLALQAGGNLVLNTAANTLSQVSDTGATRVTTTLGPVASINVTGNAAITTGGNFEQDAASLNVGGALGMSIGGNWNLGVLQTGETKVVARANGISDTHIVSDVGSSVKVGGASLIAVGGDLTATGANINLGGGGAVVAGGNVTLQAATATSTVDSNSSGSDHHGSYAETLHTSDDAVTGTTLKSGDSLAIVSGKDINVVGSTVSLDKGNALLMAAGNVNVGATTETHVSNTDETDSHSGVASHTSAVNHVAQSATYADGSTISADGVSVVSGKDINVTGSSIVGTNSVALAAQGNVNILAATDTYQDSEFHDVKHSGLSGSGGFGFSVGSSEQKDQYDASSITQSQSRSTVGAVQGNVSITAGKDVHIGGSDVIAGQAKGDITSATGNISIAGQNVTIDPAQDSAQSHDQQEARSSGVTVAVTGTPLDAARDLKANASSGNGFQRTQNVLNGIGASAADTPSISVSYGSSHSSSTTDISSLTNAGSTIRGGGNVSVTATGGAVKDANGLPIDGDLSVIGSTISAGGTASLTANRNVTLQSSTDQLQQSTQSSSSSMGISLASPGLGDMARWISGTANNGGTSPSPYNASRSSSNGTQAQTTQTATTVSGNSVVVKSKTGDINVIGSGISGTQDVDLVASQGAINVLAGLDTSASHQDSSGRQIGSLGSNGTATGFTVGVSNNHSVQDTAAQTQSTMRSQIVSDKGDVTLDANQDVTVAGADLSAGKDLTLIGKNVNLDPGTDATQSSASQSSSQFGVSLALGGAVGNAIATINQSMNNASHAGDSRLAALDTAQAGLAAYNVYQVASSTGPTGQPLIKATVSIGGGSSHSESQSSELANDGSTLHAGGTVSVIATGSGAKDANGFATDGDINARGTQISGQDVVLNAARDINLQSAKDTSQQSSSNSSNGGSIGVGFGLGGQQNGFTIELAASSANGHANGNGVTNRDTQINAADTVTLTSGRDTNLRGAEVAANTVDANVGRDLNIASQQDTNTYDSKQTSAGFQASICVPPICYGTTVSGSANTSDQTIKDNYQSVNQQSGIYAGNGGYNINVGNHTQLDGGVVASTASADKNSLSTQTLGYTNLQNTASYSGESMGFGVSGSFGQSTPGGVNLYTPVKQAGSSTAGPQSSQGFGPSGFSASGTSSSASGTTYAAVSAGKITVRGDAGTGQDSTAGLSRDTANANGSVQNTFNAQTVQNDMAIQQMTGQVGMQVAGDIADHMQQNAIGSAKQAVKDYSDAQKRGDTAGMAQAQADYAAASQQYALWGDDGAARIASHAVVAGVGAGMGGGSVAGALGGTVAGDIAGTAASAATGDTLGGTLLSNIASGLAGAAAGGVLGGSAGAMSGANGALNADLYNRQLHPQEKTAAQQIAANAAAQGITNPDGSPITADQIENAMRAANNSQYGEIAATGVVVPLNANTPASAVYDTTGMKLATDSTGNYLVQDPSMLATPSKNVQDLITQNTGGASSPYSWGTSTAQAATPKIDPYGPFSPGWNTGDNSVGFQQPGIPAPDYVAVNGNALGLAGSLSMNLHNGQVYVGAGGSVPVAPGASVTLGWLPSNYGLPNAVQGENTDQLLGGGSYSVAACAYGACFGGNHAIGGATAVEVGLGIGASTKAINLGGSASTGVSLPVFKLPSPQ